ncbi:ribosomal protein S18-alanine N-acetyltransferase [Candidatus Bathyarchaeota archaeon]|nr:ribosomal protein S18-alanine N-acetyltransferase [Candidatus Bathyarchaeota archaeon]
MMQPDLNLLRIVKCQGRHIRGVCDIEYRSFSNPFPEEYLIELFRMFPETFLVAELDGQTVGYLVASVSGRRAHIISLAVDEKFRRRHVGSILLQTLIDNLKANGVEEILLEVRLDNIAARRLYEKFGFEATGNLRGYYEDGRDAALYRLRIY